jgi:hypothetical protein
LWIGNDVTDESGASWLGPIKLRFGCYQIYYKSGLYAVAGVGITDTNPTYTRAGFR